MQGLLLIVTKTHNIETESETGDRRAGIVLTPRNKSGYENAIIIEYKVSDCMENMKNDDILGLNQINTKDCDTHMRDVPHIKTVTKLGVAFLKKIVHIEYTKDDLK